MTFAAWANAGHPPPLFEGAGGTTELGPTGTVLGRLSRATYTESSLHLALGDRIGSRRAAETRAPGSGTIRCREYRRPAPVD
jgi:stage II sporulation SpoE-like protein